jgi:hypothetical protein
VRRAASVAWACGVTVLVTSASAVAFTRNTAIWGPSKIPVTYKVNAATFPSSLGSAAAMTAIESGFENWRAPACTVWSARNAGSSTVVSPSARDNENSVLWISGAAGSWPAELGTETSTIGITTSTFVTGGNLVDADITLNAVHFRWGDGSSNTVDAQSILTHEEGHFLGLGHTQVTGSVMIASYSGGQVRVLSSDDQSGVCALYPPGYLDAGVADGGVGSSPFGDTCTSANQCASGLCIVVSSGSGVCSVTCTDDCGCPTGFGCAPLSSGGRVCAPGTNRCAADAGVDAGARDAGVDAGADAGVRDAGVDASVPDAGARDAGTDAGVRDAGARDAGSRKDAADDAGDDAGDDRDAAAFDGILVFSTGGSEGCQCAVVGQASGASPGIRRAPSSGPLPRMLAAAFFGALVLLRRRRPRDPR